MASTLQRVVILGAGGHGQVVADILMLMVRAGEPLEVIGFLDDAEEKWNDVYLGIPVLGGIRQLHAVEHDGVILGIGNNQTRSRLYSDLQVEGRSFVVAKHPSAVVAEGVSIGSGTVICAGAVISTGTTIGRNVILNTGSTIDHHSKVAEHAHVAPGVHSGGDVIIGRGALIGIGATVMPGRRVGAWATVGASTLVNRDVAPHSVVVGVPMRVVAGHTGGQECEI